MDQKILYVGVCHFHFLKVSVMFYCMNGSAEMTLIHAKVGLAVATLLAESDSPAALCPHFFQLYEL